ncbi:phage terminase large subunit family protein [Azospirillum sp.]|uniref:phage terminase large subunit family protein n=1 Tax=Azospirillum sp. TaxID=34012 RepID=UPI003D737CA2
MTNITLATASARSLNRQLDAFVAKAGYGKSGSIPEDMTFRQWCEDLARKGLKVDRKPFRLDNRPALIPIYDAIPTTRAEAFERMLVIQKATQLGLTVWEVLANIYMAKKWGPVNIGMFLPDQSTAAFKSEHRFMPIVRSAPEILREMTHRTDEDGRTKRVGEGNVLTRQLGHSLFLFLWTSGKVSTESRPMDVVTLDEVQEMALDQIDKVRARTGDSDVQFTLLLSTANMPDLDINFWYQQGSMEVWHTRCPHCQALSDLSDPAGVFPSKSIGYNTGQIVGAPLNEYVWTCPACGGMIVDAQVGEYVVNKPGANPKIRSFLLPRTISPRMTPRNMIEAWGRAKTGDQKKSFYNRTLARPYIDADQLPVTMAHCLAAVEEGKRAGITWETSGRDTYMGIDQMGGFNAVIIKKRLHNGRQAVVHVEAVFDNDPFARCSELMDKFGVVVCVVEQLPNVNDARRFANRHKGRVFLAGYANLRDDMIVWGDALSDSDRKTAEEDRSRYAVTLHQYKAMQTALYRIRDKACLFPDPDLLEQDVIEDGKTKRLVILRDWVFMHFTKTALVVEQDEETRKSKPKVMKVGLDPHFSYANMLCDVAWARNHGTSTMILPDAPTSATQTPSGKSVQEAMPGIPTSVVKLIDAALPDGVCGRCSAFKEGMCTERDLRVRERDPSCIVYVPRSEPR